MAWLRIDDGFAANPKIAQLGDRDFRVWMRALCYCARYRTEGRLSAGAFEEIPGLAKARSQFVELGLLEENEVGELVVHDWAAFNPKDPTAAQRQQRKRDRDRYADRYPDRNGHTPSRVGTRARSRPRPEEEPSSKGSSSPADAADYALEGATSAPAANGNGDRAQAEAFVRAVGWMDPDLDEDLRARFPALNDDERLVLVELARHIEEGEAADAEAPPQGGDDDGDEGVAPAREEASAS